MLRRGLLLAMISRGDHWQVAHLMPKGAGPQNGSLDAFKERLVTARPELREHVNDLRSWAESVSTWPSPTRLPPRTADQRVHTPDTH
ncbi:hypothetical protein HNP40_002117 [Mycobacteroides chelonae]|nr:hypothetical protein [Mycobacteroides chelonae]